MARLYAGLSGYSYKLWQGPGRFYPEDLKQSEFLRHYASRYSAVEMDGTWYRMPSEKMVQGWLDGTPDGFLFCPKAHRQVTHYARLKPEAHEPLRFMLGRLAPAARAGRLGPILLQLPPVLRRNDERLAAFLAELPRAAPPLSQEPKGNGSPEVRWAIEFRHESWNAPEVEGLLRSRGVAWVAADTDEVAAQRRGTAGFHYARLRKSDYDEKALQDWASYFRSAVESGKDCFVFVKHEDEGSPWIWADRLLEICGA